MVDKCGGGAAAALMTTRRVCCVFKHRSGAMLLNKIPTKICELIYIAVVFIHMPYNTSIATDKLNFRILKCCLFSTFCLELLDQKIIFVMVASALDSKHYLTFDNIVSIKKITVSRTYQINLQI